MRRSRSRRSHVGVEDQLRYGDHVCQFYRTAAELGEVLVPYFKAGLERNESCVWVTSSPYGRDRAVSELRTAVAEFDQRAAARQIQIFAHDEWYTKHGALSTTRLVQNWLSRKNEALDSGYAGLRISGNTTFLDEDTWNEFMLYEHAVTDAFRDQPITALCSYCMTQCSADAAADVMRNHPLSLSKNHGRWDLVATTGHRRGRSAASVGRQRLPKTPELSSPLGSATELTPILEDALACHIPLFPGRVLLEGCRVRFSTAQSILMRIVIHELVVNATKYGALSEPHGKVSVRWCISANGSRRLHVTWTEEGMAKLVIPDKVGLGTLLLAQAVENCVRVFDPTGMVCTFELSLEGEDTALR
jgi:hypothetical protein